MRNFPIKVAITVSLTGIIPVVISVLIDVYLSDWKWIGEPFHSVIEAVGVFAALTLFILFMLHKPDKDSSHFLWISCALLGMGILDGFHASVQTVVSFVWLHSMATFIGSFFFVLVWLPAINVPQRLHNVLIGSVIIVFCIFGSLSASFPNVLPAMENQGVFTPAAKAINFLGGFFFLLAATRFLIRYRITEKSHDLLFANLCLLFGMAGLLFSFSSLWNASWWFWHLIRLAAYLHILGYIFIIYKQAENELRYERNKFVDILNNMEDGVYIVNQQYDIEYINPALTKEFGPFEGLKCYQYFHDRQEMCPWCKNKEVFAGKTVHWEWHSLKNQKSYDLIDTPLKKLDGTVSKLEIFRDITGRKKAEEFIKSIFESIGEGIIVVDKEYRIITANRAYCNQVKMSVEDIVGRHCYEVSHHIDKPCYKADEECPVRYTLETGKTHTSIHTHYTKEGGPVYVEITSYPMKDTSGHITSVIEIIADITEMVELKESLKKKVEELQESEERFRKISVTAQDAIVMADNEGNISYWNPAAEKIFGYTEEETNGKNLHNLIVPERFHARYLKGFKKFRETGHDAAIEKRLELSAIGKGGKEFPVELSLSAVKIKDKWNAIGIIRDITKRKRAEEKIMRDYHIQNAVNSILQISLEPITLEEQLDLILETIVSSPLLSVQPQSCIFLVEDDSEVLVMKACHRLPKSSPIICKKVPFGKCLCGKAASTGEIVFVDSCDGYHEMPILNPSPHGHYCIPILLGTRILGIINLYVEEGYKRNKEEEKFLSAVVNTLAGIIERKKIEEALKKSKDELELRVKERTDELTTTVEQLERQIVERYRAEERIKTSLKEKEVLLSEIHHRVKNNLQVISSLLYFQSKYTKDKKYQDIFKESRHRIKSMALIHEKLYQSKDLANIEFNDYIGSLINSLLKSYGVDTKKITLKKEIESFFLGIDTAIPCGLVVNELVSNALKHAFPGDREGEIKITTRLSDDDEIKLTVSDNGAGIPEDLDFRNTESLGLQLITNLTEHQLQGKIELLRHKGTEFRMTFKDLHKRRRI